MRIAGALPFAAFATVLMIATPASADAKSDALVREGLMLSEAGRYVDACPKYAEAAKIDPALNTQTNLAECYERISKTASAYNTWVKVEQIAKTLGKTKEETRAHERVVALEATVPRLKIVLPAGSTKDVVVKVDGVRIANEAIGAVAVDGGEHAVDVAAPGKKPWHDDVAVQVGSLLVEVPPFKAPGADVVQVPHYQAERPSTGFRVAGAVLAGLGAVGLGIGIIAGTNALRNRDDARTACGEDDAKKCHSEAGVDLWREAKSDGNLSTIGFIAGGTLLAAGAVLWFAAPNRPVVSGSIDPNGGGRVGVAGRF